MPPIVPSPPCGMETLHALFHRTAHNNHVLSPLCGMETGYKNPEELRADVVLSPPCGMVTWNMSSPCPCLPPKVPSPLCGMVTFVLSEVYPRLNACGFEPTVWDGDWLHLPKKFFWEPVLSPPCGMETHDELLDYPKKSKF